METASLSRIAAVVVLVCGAGGASWADTSEVKGPAPIVVGKSGKHCKDDPHCFNRYHPNIKPAVTVKQDQLFVLETRDALDSDLTFTSTAQDVAAVNSISFTRSRALCTSKGQSEVTPLR
jgi:formamidase